MIVIRCLFRLPGWLHKIKVYSKDKDAYPIHERLNFVRGILTKVPRKARVKMVITGKENLPEETFLMTPNHQGMWDIVQCFNAIDRDFKIVAKKELGDVKVLGDVLKFCDFPLMDRQNLRQSVKVIGQVRKEMAEGMSYVIFPEGTRSKIGNTMNPFKGGSFKPAMANKLPIVPVAMIDSFKPLDEKGLKKVTTQMHILPAIYEEDYRDMTTAEVAAMVQERIEQTIQKNA